MIRIMFQRDTAKQQRDDSGHVDPVGKEITSVGGECDEASFNLRVMGEGGVFEDERHGEAKDDSEGHGDAE